MAYPENLNIWLCGTDILVPRSVAKGGNYWWVFLDESGDPAWRGVVLQPPAEELPRTMSIHGVEVTLEPVPIWDKKTKQVLDDTHPFEKTRRAHCHIGIEGLYLQVQSRVTIRKDGNWNFSFKSWQADPPSAAPNDGIHTVVGD